MILSVNGECKALVDNNVLYIKRVSAFPLQTAHLEYKSSTKNDINRPEKNNLSE